MNTYAGFWRRLLASMIDTFLFAVSLAILLSPTVKLTATSTIQDVTSQILTFAATVIFWIRYMGTPGKLLLGCQIVDADTFKPIGLRQAIVRYLSYIVSLLPLCLGFLWIAWDRRKQGFHDKIANTVVVHNQAFEVQDESQKPLMRLISELR